jgi:hypothetical protein
MGLTISLPSSLLFCHSALGVSSGLRSKLPNSGKRNLINGMNAVQVSICYVRSAIH